MICFSCRPWTPSKIASYQVSPDRCDHLGVSNLNHIWEVIGRLLLEISAANWRELSHNPWKVVVSTLWVKNVRRAWVHLPYVLGWKFQTIPWNHQHLYPKYPHWREHIQGSLCQFADSTKPETSGRSPIFLWQTIPKVCACLYITFKTFCGSIEGGFTTTTKIDCFSISSHWRRIIKKKPWKQGIVSQDHSNTENERLKPDKGDSLPEFSFNFVSLFKSVYFRKGVENQERDC